MKSDRFLLAILGGIAVIVILSLVVFFTRSRQVDYVADDSPEAVTQNYILAIHRQDYERAYAYLAAGETAPTYEQFRQFFFNQANAIANTSVQITSADVSGEQATVGLNVLHGGGGLLSDPYRETTAAVLAQSSGGWRIVQLPHPYASWDWFQEAVPSRPLPRAIPVR